MSIQRIVLDQLWSGTSFQPPWKRFPSQVPRGGMLNVDPDVVTGARDRNGTDWQNQLLFTGGAHWERLRQFIIVIRPSSVKVFSEFGVEQTVIDATGTNFSYLAGITPEVDVDTVTVGDTVLIANKNVTTAMTTSPDYTTKGEVSFFSDLISDQPDPTTGQPTAVQSPPPVIGDKWKVLLTSDNAPASYYEYNGGGQTEPAAWDRITPPNDPDCIWDNSTMPHGLLYNPADGTFTFRAENWSDRLSGNSVTNPAPQFNGFSIDVMSYFQNRIIILGNNVIVTTQGGNADKFSFFSNDVNNKATPTDPLNLDNNLQQLGTPYRAQICGRDLLIGCSNGQMKLTSGADPLNNTNGRLFPVGSFPTRPIKMETNGEITVVIDYNNYVHAYAYQNTQVGAVYLATLNDHNPKVLQPSQPGDKVVRRAYIVKDRIVVCTDNDAAIFKYKIDNGTMVQAAWNVWQFFDSEHRLIYIDQQGANFRLITKDNDERHFLVTYYPDIEPQDPDWEYLPALDYRELKTYAAYNAALDQTGFDMSVLEASENYWMVENADGFNRFHKAVRWSGRRVWFQGDFRTLTCYIGVDFETNLKLTSLWAGPVNERPIIKECSVTTALNTTNYIFGQKRTGAATYLTKNVQGFPLGAKKLDSTMNVEGIFNCTLAGDARYQEILLKKRGPGRVTWSTVAYTVDIQSLGGRY